VITTPPITRTYTSFMPTSMFEPSPVVETQIPDVPHPGETLRDRYFALHEGMVEVAPNQPKSNFYVMVLDRREPATFASLYAPNGDEYRYKAMARDQASRQQEQQWMSWLREQAGLKPDWLPPDEAKREEAARK
jgi:peptidyl-prolyl cis-trans isomerase D